MIATKEQLEEFERLVRPLIKFLCDNCHPHVSVIVTPMHVLFSEYFNSNLSILIKPNKRALSLFFV